MLFCSLEGGVESPLGAVSLWCVQLGMRDKSRGPGDAGDLWWLSRLGPEGSGAGGEVGGLSAGEDRRAIPLRSYLWKKMLSL